MVAHISGLQSDHHNNIAFLEVFRSARGSLASMVIETDQPVNTVIIEELTSLEGDQEVLLDDCACI